MHLQQELDNSRLRIRSYDPAAGQIRIGETFYQYPVVLRNNQITRFEACDQFSQLSLEHLTSLTSDIPEILVIGCGAGFQLMPLELQRQLEGLGIASEVMATREACHTYEVLSYEQRDVVALLFL